MLLAGPDEHSVVADTSGPEFQAARLALEARELTFGAYLADAGLVLRTDLLGAWAHWITPSFEPRRFDTRFFVAVLPEGQAVGELAREADRALWAPLSEVLAAVEAGAAGDAAADVLHLQGDRRTRGVRGPAAAASARTRHRARAGRGRRRAVPRERHGGLS